jgi:hypothetical protein
MQTSLHGTLVLGRSPEEDAVARPGASPHAVILPQVRKQVDNVLVYMLRFAEKFVSIKAK